MPSALDSMRSAVNKQSAMVLLGAALVVVICALMVYKYQASPPPPPAPKNAFYLDEAAWDPALPVARPLTEVPPLPTDHGNTLVRAVYYTESTDDARQLAYCERYTPDARQTLLQDPKNALAENDGAEVRGPETGAKWVRRYSADGLAIVSRFSPQTSKDPSNFRIVFPK